jgi:phage terminase large subunit
MSAEAIQAWRADPRRFVRDVFGVTPDAWQDDVLEAFPHQQKIALKASKGPGKTAVEAWCAWNFLLTRPHPKIVATSITAENLADNLWTEMAKWQHKSELLKAAFTWGKTRIFANDHPETWWMSARTWPKTASAEEQAETLAGLHADYVLFVIDESGSIPPAVLVAAEATLATCTEGHILQGGNTTSPNGMLYEAAITQRKNWHVVTVTGDPEDPKRSARVSIEWAQNLIDRYGRDHPYVLVNVLGQFPPASFNTLVSIDDIREAQSRNYAEPDIRQHPRILGVDVALYGDDISVIWPRQGLVSFNPMRFRNIEPHLGAGLVAQKWIDWDANAVFVDNTGGYGAAWISHLRLMQRFPVGVGFAQAPNDEQFFNKRAEIYFLGAQWIKDGGKLPPASVPGMAELTAALTQTTYTTRRDKLILEPKELIKERIGYSPDDADAFCLTFSHRVAPRRANIMPQVRHREPEWSPRAALEADGYGLR